MTGIEHLNRGVELALKDHVAFALAAEGAGAGRPLVEADRWLPIEIVPQ